MDTCMVLEKKNYNQKQISAIMLLYLNELDYFMFPVDLAVWMAQMLVHRRRPKYNKDDMHLVVSVDKYSFPSG